MAIDAARASALPGDERGADRAVAPPQPTLAPGGDLSRLDSRLRAEVVTALQRSGGNAAVATLAREAKKRRSRPKSPSKPTEFMTYQCDPQRTFHVEIFTAMNTEELQTHISKARQVLLAHNIKLEIEIKGISSDFYPLGYDVNLPDGKSGTVRDKEDACKLIGATIEDSGHTEGWMPVFYIPCDAAALGAHAEGAHIKGADADLCAEGGTTHLQNVVLIDTRQTGYHQVLLHELGHAAGIHPHTDDTFLDPKGRQGKDLDAINHHQVEQLCKAPFAT